MPDRTLHGDEPRYPAGLRDLGGGLYAWLQPNGTWGESNAGLVVGRGESLLVDTLWDLPLTRRLLDELQPITADAPIRTVVNTHSDGDHCWGNQLVGSAEIVSSTASAEEMEQLKPAELSRFGLLARAFALVGRVPVLGPDDLKGAGDTLLTMTGPFDFGGIELTLPTRRFDGELGLEVGGRRVELIEVGPAHTPGDLIVHVPDASTVFSGDILFLGATPVMWTGPPENWIAALDRILALEPKTVVPGHGPVTGTDGVEQVRDYFTFLAAEARAGHDRGKSAFECARDILHSPAFAERDFAEWLNPERIAINVWTCYRHLDGEAGDISLVDRIRVFGWTGRLADERLARPLP